MTPRNWFGVAIRTVGLWTTIRGVMGFVTVVARQNGWVEDSNSSPQFYYLYTVAESGIGLFLLLGADLIVRVSYPSARPADAAPESDNSAPPTQDIPTP